MKTKTTKPQDAHTPDDIPFTIHMEPRTAEQIKHERLIAAAPMMLVALESIMIQAISVPGETQSSRIKNMTDTARAAILAAKGA